MYRIPASNGMTDRVSSNPASSAETVRGDRAIAWWLLVCCALVFAMVVLGGVTRLTGSGLSIVHWKPISGVLPPIGEAAWEREFAHYRQSPEYAHVNKGMSLGEFKGIFWFEYAHRLLGRLIGVAFILPFLYFLVRRRIERWLVPRLAAMFVLGGLQGLLGWYMVKSGLVDNPHVSHYRLAAHLALAVIIYAFMLWTALSILRRDGGVEPAGARALVPVVAVVLAAVFLTMLTGAFVAGLKAGFIYNTFPLMGGRWWPEGMWSMTPAYINVFENPATVQFIHRWVASATFLLIVAFWLGARRRDPGRRARMWLDAVGIAAAVQVALGISTLLTRVPVPLAALHQAGAMVLVTLLLCLAYESRSRRPV